MEPTSLIIKKIVIQKKKCFFSSKNLFTRTISVISNDFDLTLSDQKCGKTDSKSSFSVNKSHFRGETANGNKQLKDTKT